MLILKQFYDEFDQIHAFDQSNLNYKDITPDSKYIEYEEYIQNRLDFSSKWKRIIRALDLLTDEQYIFLFDYFHGMYLTGINQETDDKLVKLIYEVENGI